MQIVEDSCGNVNLNVLFIHKCSTLYTFNAKKLQQQLEFRKKKNKTTNQDPHGPKYCLKISVERRVWKYKRQLEKLGSLTTRVRI